jgi:hypothetical protein
MRWYFKEYPGGGWQYTPVGRKVDEKKLANGFIIVDAIPQRILDRQPGGKDYVEPEHPRDTKLRELEERIAELEAKAAP